jgi:hypothetical protein
VQILTSTLPVRLTVADLWAGLERKAENPVGYVPAITACTVLERTDTGFVREIVVQDVVRQRERVTFQHMKRVVFDQLTDPDLATIVNEITEDQHGVWFTLVVTLSSAGIARAEREPRFLSETREYFASTVRPIVDELHRAAEQPGVSATSSDPTGARHISQVPGGNVGGVPLSDSSGRRDR